MATKPDRPYPDVLPEIDPAWLVWHDGAVRHIAEQIWTNSEWESLPILADAIEDAGCTDPVIIQHLRSSHQKPYCDGCWQRSCWLVNHLLGRAQPLVARFKWPGHDEEDEAVVINPGDSYGATYLVFVADCFDPPLYIVEAENASDAQDEFIDSPYGVSEHIDPEDDFNNDDYGFHLHVGDMIGGTTIDEDGWYDLRNNYLGNSEDDERPEPSFTGGGTMYDGENIQIHGDEISRYNLGDRQPFRCTYFGPGLPPNGLSPLSYYRRTECRECGKTFFPSVPLTDWGREEICSVECWRNSQWAPEEDYPPGEIAAHIG